MSNVHNTNGYTISVDAIFIRNMVRYEVLDQLIPKAFQGYDSKEINIFIDLYSIYRTMFSRGFHTDVKDYREFTVYLIDLSTHYRTYFRYIGVQSKIFIISSFNTPTNITIPGYNQKMKDKLMNKPVRDMYTVNNELLKILCPYLPDIHFLETKYESSVLMYELINREKQNPSLIISSDIYPIQLTTLFDNVAYLWPIKSRLGDESVIIYPKTHSQAKFTLWPVFIRKSHKIAREHKLGSLSARNLVLLESMTSVEERDLVPSLINLSTSSRYIYSIIGEEDVALNPDFLLEIKGFKYPEKIPIIKDRMAALNVEYQYEYYKGSLEQMSLHYENLSDPQAVQIINDKYFTNNPIDILRL
jgi:hypothetical protein